MSIVIVFGGSGFVGTHLVYELLRKYEKIVIADIKTPGWHEGSVKLENNKVEYVYCDVRNKIELADYGRNVNCIINLAAVHTSPGYPARDYFEANILGAKNICNFANMAGCNRIIFTSSISVYGPGEDEKYEEHIPMPNIPYGVSKIIAEYIHREWYNFASNTRMLTIIRPGVIFGRGEGGNFTRMANALQKGLFIYPGRKDTIKACIYVKDVCNFIIEMTNVDKGYSLFNFCYPQKITIEEIVKTFKDTIGYNTPELVLPFKLIVKGTSVLNRLPIKTIRTMGLVPERIEKLIKSTNISSQKLVKSGFKFRYSLKNAIMDWAGECKGKKLY